MQIAIRSNRIQWVTVTRSLIPTTTTKTVVLHWITAAAEGYHVVHRNHVHPIAYLKTIIIPASPAIRAVVDVIITPKVSCNYMNNNSSNSSLFWAH